MGILLLSIERDLSEEFLAVFGNELDWIGISGLIL
jgi:hypothetical protein